ncbi:MAG: hypothetical protein ACK4QP_04365 [Pseudorhizobium sp.]
MSRDKHTTDDPDTDAERAREQNDYLEEALKETFPASDPIAPGDPSHKSPAKPERENIKP